MLRLPMPRIALFVLAMLAAAGTVAQHAKPNLALGKAAGYAWVFFTDKGPEAFMHLRNPQVLLSDAALQRRVHEQIPVDETDVPVSATYLNYLRSRGIAVAGTSRWFNAALVVTDNEMPYKLAGLACVAGVQPHGRYKPKTTAQGVPCTTSVLGAAFYGSTFTATRMLNLDGLHSRCFDGRGIRIGVFDSGFLAADVTPQFGKLFSEKRILATRDFFIPGGNVYLQDSHGATCLSVLAAVQPGTYVGAAPGASYVLARTENVAYERHIEELAWANALEWADSAGVRVISSSVSYNVFDAGEGDYTLAQLNGRTAIISRAAAMAARKGILVVNSAGNEGNSFWRKICVPCDADSILCVGAVNAQGDVAGFSSRGPSADRRVKPDVVALGVQMPIVLPGPNAAVSRTNGTSYSTPAVAGMAACLWQANPTARMLQLRDAIVRSSNSFATPDSNRGYGIPNAMLADAILKQTLDGLPTANNTGPRLLVFPNPAGQAITVVLQADQFDTYDLTLVDATGRQVLAQSGLTCNVRYPLTVATLANGTYVAWARYGGRPLSQKVVIAR
jgi:hypothetical protein